IGRVGPARRGRPVIGGGGRSHPDPGLEVGDLLVRKFSLRRHLEILIAPSNRLDDPTLLGIAGDDRRARVAALEEPFAGVEEEPALELLRALAVALVAALDQTRADALLEEFDLLRGGRRRFLLRYGRGRDQERPYG